MEITFKADTSCSITFVTCEQALAGRVWARLEELTISKVA